VKALPIIVTAITVTTGAMAAPVELPHIECGLSQQQRDKIWNEIHFCVQRMHNNMDKAEREARQITDIDVEGATKAAIVGAVGGLSTGNPYGVVITSCLNTLGTIAGDSYWHFRESKKYVREAEYYAYRADELQERLWRDE